MTPEEKTDFVSTYVEYLRWNRLPDSLPRNKDEVETFLAQADARANVNPYQDDIWDLCDAIHRDPELAWELLLAIIERAEIADVGLLGAGDLETFVHVQAVPFAGRIEREIRNNEKFRKAFESVYIGGETPEEVGRKFNTALRESGVAEEHIIDWWS